MAANVRSNMNNIDNINLKDIKLRLSDITPMDSQKGRQQPGTGKKTRGRVSDYDCSNDSPNKFNSFGEYNGEVRPEDDDNDSDAMETLLVENEKM